MSTAIATHLPESFRPDRKESIHRVSEAPSQEWAPGVTFDCLVGAHTGARHLSTGSLTLTAGAQLPYQRLPASVSLTVVAGAALVSVEGREYRLERLDNLTIPRGLPHAVRNVAPTGATQLHVAVAAAALERERVATPFQFTSIPRSEISADAAGKEYVTRFATARRSQAGPGTSFIDHFNQELMPGLEMSGGYGHFQRGGRLPAHFHDFDESICIIEGTATCIVEGRRYQMSDGATALQPRGRVHYFINEQEAPMAMLWVYAGPLPERIVTDERLATAEGNPWK